MSWNVNGERSKTGEWKPIKGKTYTSSKAKLAGKTHLQEAVRILNTVLCVEKS